MNSQNAISSWAEKDSKNYMYKKSSYHYSNSENNNIFYRPVDKNTDKLDELLEDLRNEREHNKDISRKSLENKCTKYQTDIGQEASADHICTVNSTEHLQNMALSEGILPLPGVKVTTTVRTYTYEIPADSSADGVCKSSTIKRNDRTKYVPPSITYNTESYSTINQEDKSPFEIHNSIEKRDKADSITQDDFIAPKFHLRKAIPIGTTKMITSENKESATERTLKGNPATIINYQQESMLNKYYHSEPLNAVKASHEIKSSNGLNKITYSKQNSPLLPPLSPTKSSSVYNYSSTSNYSHAPDCRPPLCHTQPAPFPLNGCNVICDNNPPERVDDLMLSFGNSDTIDNSSHESTHRKREIETAVATSNQQKVSSVKKSGDNVYYPPGHEMMLVKRAEMFSGSSAGGRWAKESEMYEKESGYKSKLKTKSGSAVVPVCLPLCCALPCSIM